MLRSAVTATFIAVAVQIFTVGLLAPRLPREVCRPGVDSVKSFTFTAAPVLRVVNTDGAVRIHTSDEIDVIQIDARIRAYTTGLDGMLQAESYLETLFKITEAEDMVILVTEPDMRPDPVDLRVDYTITVPYGTDIALDVSNGNVWVAQNCNHVTVEGNNADIEVLKPLGKVSVKTINGRIRAFECADETILETVNGSIQASLTQGALQASTITGAITATLLEDGVTVCDLTSLNGSITLVMSERLSVAVNAATARGAVRAEMPLVPVRGVQRRREVHGIMGKGDTKVSVNSMNGDITLQRSVT